MAASGEKPMAVDIKPKLARGDRCLAGPAIARH
jgi:hypothetical protein